MFDFFPKQRAAAANGTKKAPATTGITTRSRHPRGTNATAERHVTGGMPVNGEEEAATPPGT